MNASIAPHQHDGTEDAVLAKRHHHKAEDAYRTISEVADELHVAQHVLRFWESKFKQIEPLKRAGGRRYYRREDVDLLKRIHYLLYTQGYTIKGVQKLLTKDRHLFQAVPNLQDKSAAAAATSIALGQTVTSWTTPSVTAPVETVTAKAPANPLETADDTNNDQLNLFNASDRVLMQDVLRRLKKIHNFLES